MPQLMPLYWSVSILMIFLILIMLCFLYFTNEFSENKFINVYGLKNFNIFMMNLYKW